MIYRYLSLQMKKQLDIKLVRFYLWTGLIYLMLGAFGMLGFHPGKILLLLLNSTWGVLYIIFFNFILFEYALPFILRKGRSVFFKILLGLLGAIIYLLIYSYGSYAWRLLGEQLHIYRFLDTYDSLSGYLRISLIYSIISIVVFGIGRHLYGHLALRQLSQQLQIEMQKAELNYLKSQTNPHFLFNTLNNIYSLASDKSDLAPEAIFRLSEILRFMLYETSEPKIPIEQEVKIINDYIELEKLRYDDSLQVNFKYNFEEPGQMLPPLLMIPLVENAFKHGASETIANPFVDIQLSVNKIQLELLVTNSAESYQVERISKKNIGLANLRRQLELLYPHHQLLVQQDNSVYTAFLKISFNNHV